MSRSNPTLEAAIRANPDDPRPWAVYGDWLEAEGDPRGTLVGLMLAREETPTAALARAVKGFLEANQAWLLGVTLGFEESATWHRGFLSAVYCRRLETLEAVVAHPSARFLHHLGFHGPTPDDVDAWRAVLARCDFPSAQVLIASVAAPVLAWPRLERLTLELPYSEPPALAWDQAKRLRWLRLGRPPRAVLEALLERPPPALEELRLFDCDDEALALLVEHDLSHLRFVAVDGHHSAEALDALASARRPGRLVLGMASDAEARLAGEVPGVSAYDVPERLETAVVVLDAPTLSGDARAVLERLAQAGGSSALVVFTGPARLGTHAVTVCRFHGDDPNGSLLPVGLAHALTRALKVRTAVITLSESNDFSKALCFGLGVEPAPKEKEKRARPRVEMAAAHKVESGHASRDVIAREVLSRMLGVDPGPNALDDLLDAVDESLPVTLQGPRFVSGMALPPLLTEEPATEEPADGEDEEYDEDEENEDDWDDEWDTLVEPTDAAPEVEDEKPDREPSRIDLPIAVPVVEVAAEDEDEDEEDPDEHVPDLVDADEGEIWNEGPVDAPEEWTIPEDPPLPSEPDPEQLSPEQAEPAIAPSCVRCARPAETTQCRLCFDELCEVCLPPGERRVCAQCVPI